MIKNIIFDMGGVMIDFAPDKFVERYPVLSAEEKQLLSKVIFKGHMWSALDFGYISEEDLIEYAKEKLPERLHVVAEDLVRTWDDPIIPMEGMAELTTELKEAGFKLYLLSNAGPRHDEYWPKIPGSSNFDGKVISAYEKLYKPQTEIYELLLKRFGLRADESVFIDDVAPNCCAAWICGIDTIVFRGAEDLRKELKERGIFF